ncbi:MAG: hypothetical protein ACE10K_04410 [Rhodothermales bacterium]
MNIAGYKERRHNVQNMYASGGRWGPLCGRIPILDFRFWILDCFSDADRETEKATTIGTAAAFSTEMTVLDETNPHERSD